MWSRPNNAHTAFPLHLKKSASLFCLFLSMIVVACGGESSQSVPATPAASVTIALDRTTASPTPTLLPYYCGGWATETTPGYRAKGVVLIYGKFTQTMSGNPVGV